MALDGALPPGPAGDGELLPFPQHSEQVGIGRRILLELGAAGIDAALELSHGGPILSASLADGRVSESANLDDAAFGAPRPVRGEDLCVDPLAERHAQPVGQ